MASVCTHRALVRSSRLLAGVVCLLTGFFVLPARGAPPNVLLILTDDQGWPTLGSYGNRRVPTPHLDRLAADGVRFQACYVMPQCTPTRAALLTGQHTARNGMWHVIPGYGYPLARLREPDFARGLPRDTFTIGSGLRAAGYTTGIIGKWHVTANADGDYTGLRPTAAAHYGFDLSVPSLRNEAARGDKGVDRFTDEAIRFIESHRDEPWFLYLSHHTIHGPVLAPEPLVAKYRADGAPETGLHNATYLAAIEHMDRAVGRLVARLDALGLGDNTVVIFLSDNGGIYQFFDPAPFRAADEPTQTTPTELTLGREEFSNAPLRAGKGGPYEGGIRVPCIVRWPGVVEPGQVSETPIHVVDWMPTLLEIAGAKAPDGHAIDGMSLVPLLRGESLPPRPLYWYLPLYEVRWPTTPCAIVREGDWKLIEFFGDWFDADGRYRVGHRLELYNLKSDIGEQTNLADKQPARAARLQEQLRAWLKSVEAEVPAPNPEFDEPRQLLEVGVGKDGKLREVPRRP
ncbi:MAG: sulfatase [Planctomycetota bacterium]